MSECVRFRFRVGHRESAVGMRFRPQQCFDNGGLTHLGVRSEGEGEDTGEEEGMGEDVDTTVRLN